MKEGEAPVFVKVEDYKDVLDMLDLIKDKLEQAKNILGNINEIKNEEDSELNLWESTLNEVEKKVHNIDKVLFEPESVW
jgi:hypothetical protein